MYEPVAFTQLFLAPYLQFSQRKEHVALHVPCTSKQAGLSDKFVQLASRCSQQVSLTDISCCGMAGDRGMRFPELTRSACQHVNPDVADASDGYSNSRTCEIGVSAATGAVCGRRATIRGGRQAQTSPDASLACCMLAACVLHMRATQANSSAASCSWWTSARSQTPRPWRQRASCRSRRSVRTAAGPR
jgi:hypothetical protein